MSDVVEQAMMAMSKEHRNKARYAMHRMARALDLDEESYPPTPEGDTRIWADVCEAVTAKGFLQSPANAPVEPGDPFCVALTAICQDGHDGQGWWRQTAVVKTEAMVDQAEAEKIIAYLQAQEAVATCDATLIGGERCGKSITCWSTSTSRVSELAVADGYAMETSTTGTPA